MVGGYETEVYIQQCSKYQLGPEAWVLAFMGTVSCCVFPQIHHIFSLYNYGLEHHTLCVNLSDLPGLDHSLGSKVIAVFSKRRCLHATPYTLGGALACCILLQDEISRPRMVHFKIRDNLPSMHA